MVATSDSNVAPGSRQDPFDDCSTELQPRQSRYSGPIESDSAKKRAHAKRERRGLRQERHHGGNWSRKQGHARRRGYMASTVMLGHIHIPVGSRPRISSPEPGYGNEAPKSRHSESVKCRVERKLSVASRTPQSAAISI